MKFFTTLVRDLSLIYMILYANDIHLQTALEMKCYIIEKLKC